MEEKKKKDHTEHRGDCLTVHQSADTFLSGQALARQLMTTHRATSSHIPRTDSPSEQKGAELDEVGPPTTEEQLSDGEWHCQLSQEGKKASDTQGVECTVTRTTVLCRIHQIPIHGIRTPWGISVLLKSKGERTPPSPG